MDKIIIANNNIGAMLKGAKEILDKYKTNGEIPEKIKGQASLSVLKNITQNKKFFSICEIDALAKMNNIIFSVEHREFMSSLHCIQWDEMHPDTREYLFALLIDYFKGNIVMSYAA